MPHIQTITRCPRCGTAFRASKSQLTAANGLVRCGSCLSVFRAINKSKNQHSANSTQNTQAKIQQTKLSKQSHSSNQTDPSHSVKTPELINDSHHETEYRNKDGLYGPDGGITPIEPPLFERQSRSFLKQDKDAIDESWALEILTELEKNKTDPAVDDTQINKKKNTSILNETKPVTANVSAPEATSCPEQTDQKEKVSHFAISDNTYISSIDAPPIEIQVNSNKKRNFYGWTILSLLATLALLSQLFIYKANELSQIPQLNLLYQTSCKLIRCTFLEKIDFSKIRTTNVVIRSDSDNPDALTLHAILINSGDFEQPYPKLQLTFSDINGNAVASRTLLPLDYLQGELAGAKLMPIQQPVQLSLELLDPGKDAINYQLNVLEATP